MEVMNEVFYVAFCFQSTHTFSKDMYFPLQN